MEGCELCGIEWAMWNTVGYKEHFGLYGRYSAVWKSLGCVEECGLCGIE